MGTIADPLVLNSLVERLNRLRPDTQRRWDTMTPGEMLCHLGDAHESVLGIRVPPGKPPTGVPRPVLKWVALYSPIPWPKGARTRAGVDPRREGTRPGDFEEGRARAVSSLQRLAAADSTGMAAIHFMFGPMAVRDWHQWAYRHINHHLRQFGL